VRFLVLTLRGVWFVLFGTLRILFRLLKRAFRAVRRAFRGASHRHQAAHGSARFAKPLEVLLGGLMSKPGPVIGIGAFRRIIRFTADGLVMVFAATGAGKGLGIVVPTLLDYPGSIVVTDPKGENFAITARHRAGLGAVRMLNPADLVHSDRFNPLDMIRAGTDLEADDAKALAKLMVRPDSRDVHWDEKTVSLLTALILHTLRQPKECRTLSFVRSLSIGGPETLCETLQEIAETSPSLHAAEIAGGFLAQAGEVSPEFKSIISNLHKATECWSAGSPAGRLSSSSTFHLHELVDQVATLYFCVDEELLEVYDRWLRVMTGCVLNMLTRSKHRTRPLHKVVLLIDEAAVLGPLEPLEKQSGLLRAYCTPVLIWQSYPQAAAIYGERAAAFLANASCRVFFGVNDNDTANYVSTMLGKTTTYSRSVGVSHASEALLPHHEQEGESESCYWLMDPSEVQRLPTSRLVAKFRDIAFPVLAERLDYRRVWRWRHRWDNWITNRTGSGLHDRATIPARVPEEQSIVPVHAAARESLPVHFEVRPTPSPSQQ